MKIFKNGNIKLKKVDIFNRYYSKDYIENNELKLFKFIDKKRNYDDSYPFFFNKDKDFINFCNDCDIVVGHNVFYDLSLTPLKINKIFDTLNENIEILKIPFKNNKYKFPKLSEVLSFYKIDFDEKKLHNSMYDIEKTYELFKKMIMFDKFDCKIKKLIITEESITHHL